MIQESHYSKYQAPIKKPVRDGDTKRLLKALTERLDAFVAEKKLIRSKASNKILEVIIEETHHFRAQDIVEKLQARLPDEVGRSTVYRNLPILVECGLIQEDPSDVDGQVLYELADEEHRDHIVCMDCHHIFEFHDGSIEARQARVSKNMEFTMRDHRHVVYASCDRLKSKGN